MSTCTCLGETTHRARKAHRCTLCGERIERGERYINRTGVGDGFWHMRMHPECVAYEQSPEQPVDPDWYEDCGEPIIERANALAYAARRELLCET